MQTSLATTDEPAYWQGLNPAQRGAVEALDGPVLVLAGAGTGKTRVLTARLVHLLATGKAVPGQILAVTFTNKAAAEIRERISHMIGRSVEGWFLGTFHSLAARLLRPHAELVGLKPNLPFWIRMIRSGSSSNCLKPKISMTRNHRGASSLQFSAAGKIAACCLRM